MTAEIEEKIEYIIEKFFELTGNQCIFYPYVAEEDFQLEIDKEHWFCAMIASNVDGCALCERKRLSLLRSAFRTQEAAFSECHAGIGEFVVPCFHNKHLIGMFVVYTVPAIEYIPNMKRMACYYKSVFGIDENKLEAYIAGLPPIHRFAVKPEMLLLQALVKVNIDSGLLKAINTTKSNEFEAWQEEEALGESFALSYTNIMLEGERAGNIYNLLESNAQQLVNEIYCSLRTGQSMRAREKYDRLFAPALRDNNIDVVQFNTITNFIRLAVFMTKRFPDCWEFYFSAMPIPKRINAAKSDTAINQILDGFFADMVTVYQREKLKHPVVERMINYIDENYSKKISLETMAAKLHISNSYASRMFKEHMGVNFKWYLNEVRMDAAYNYLKRTTIPIQDVAMRVGYSEIRSFYKMFKQHFGVTCTQIRDLYSTDKAFTLKNAEGRTEKNTESSIEV